MSSPASISAQSISSVNAKHSQLSLRSWPVLWRRLVLYVCPYLQPDLEQAVHSLPRASLEEVSEVPEECRISGALPNDDLYQDNPHRLPCLTGSCLKAASPGLDIRRKPLPQSSDAVSVRHSVHRRASLDEIRPAIEAFTHEIDTIFLSPTAKLVLRNLKKLSEVPQTTTRVLVQLDAGEPIWMNAMDADILYQLRQITNSLPEEDKRNLLQEIANLIDPRAKYPLRQVMFHGVNIQPDVLERLDEREDPESRLDVFDLLRQGESPEEARAALTPPPLMISKRQRDNLSQPEITNSVIECNEPTATEPEDTTGSSTSTDIPSGSVPSELLSRVSASSRSSPEHKEATRPGNVRKGRLAAEAARRPRTSESGQTSPSTTTTSPVQTPRVTEAGSTFMRDQDLFVNPRKAPLPPIKPAKRLLIHRALEALRLPRSATSATRMPHAVEADSNANCELGDPRSSMTSLTPTLRSGSVRKAREALRNKEPGSVREALQRLDPTVVELPLPPAKPVSPHTRFPRSSSLPRKPQESIIIRGRIDKSASLPNFAPHLAGGPSIRAGAFDHDVLPEGREDLRWEQEHSERSQGLDKDVANGRPSPVRTLSVEDLPHRPRSSHGIVVTRHVQVQRDTTGLRGGASNESDLSSAQSQTSLRRVTTIFGGRVNRLEDYERPHSGLWWLSGGKVGRRSQVPTAAELRERRSVEEANREVVGYWGTAFGVRAVKKLSVSAGDDQGKKGGKDEDFEGDGAANEGGKKEDGSSVSTDEAAEKADET